MLWVGPVTEARQEVPPTVHCADPSARVSRPRSHFRVLRGEGARWVTKLRGGTGQQAEGRRRRGRVEAAAGQRADRHLI